MKVAPPLYLLGKKVCCWHCSSRMTVVALLAPNVEGAEGEVCIISNVQGLPKDVLSFIQQKVPTYRFRASRTAGSKYFANTCPKCQAIYGDFFLHDEPGAPFLPESEDAARVLYVTGIPIASAVEIQRAPGIGVDELILQHAKRI
jgi:hypothetical protein